jgi:hypothetical protein
MQTTYGEINQSHVAGYGLKKFISLLRRSTFLNLKVHQHVHKGTPHTAVDWIP